jgi:hypothetical protein
VAGGGKVVEMSRQEFLVAMNNRLTCCLSAIQTGQKMDSVCPDFCRDLGSELDQLSTMAFGFARQIEEKKVA